MYTGFIMDLIMPMDVVSKARREPMKTIKIEDQKALQQLKLQLAANEVALQQIQDDHIQALKERQGAQGLAEFASLASLNMQFAQAGKFDKKFRCFLQLNETSEAYFRDFQTAMCLFLNTSNSQPAKELQTRQVVFETTARQYHASLVQMNLQLEKLRLNRSNKTSHFKTPDVSQDIKQLQGQVLVLDTKIKAFDKSMQEASLRWIQDESTWQDVQPISLNLKTAINNLQSEYSKAYDKAFGSSGFWRTLKNHVQKKERALEIQFLKDVSEHPEANDAIRYQAMLLVHNKISNSECFGEHSQLKKLLNKLTLPPFKGFRNEQNDLNRFLEEHQDIKLPAGIARYYEKHQDQYSCEDIVRYV